MNSPQNEHQPDQQTPTGDPVQDEVTESAPTPPDSPKSQPAETGSLLMTLREQLQELRTRFDATDAQIANYLRDSATLPSASTGNGEAMAHVQESLDRLLTKVDELAPSPADSPEGSPATPSIGGNQEVLDTLKKLAEHQSHLAGKVVNTLAKRILEELDLLRIQQIVHETLTTELDRREAVAEEKNAPPPDEDPMSLTDSDEDIQLNEVDLTEEPPPEETSSNDDWSRAIWGDGLVESEAFASFLEELNQRLLDGDREIANLAGRLLIFRQAPPEAKPQLLKDVGEAYYRTQIDQNQPNRPFEHALIDWLQADCDKSGLPNTIEVVHVGERFDKSRHTSTTRGGAEVSEVFGWIVLTEGGRVYTRATVAAQ